MNGPYHYKKAESLMALANTEHTGQNERADLVAQAQVHATLAQVSATCYRFLATGDEDRKEWIDAIR